MSTASLAYYELLLARTQKILEKHYFAVTISQTLTHATDYFLTELVGAEVRTVGFGGSATVGTAEIVKKLKANPSLTVFERDNPDLTPEVKSDYAHQSLGVDLYVASANAVTLDGEIVNLDRTGNRVAAIAFGPKKVALFVGRNKICRNLNEAKSRIKNLAAPMNAIRLGFSTPCAQTGECRDCQGASRICAVWTITERSFPVGRIHVLLVNEDLGF
jgi:hypothetical protein